MSVPGPVAAQGGAGRDLADRRDVERLVTAFYLRAFADPLIGPVFTEVARMDLDAHMPVMCDFWESVLFAHAAGTGATRSPRIWPCTAWPPWARSTSAAGWRCGR